MFSSEYVQILLICVCNEGTGLFFSGNGQILVAMVNSLHLTEVCTAIAHTLDDDDDDDEEETHPH